MSNFKKILYYSIGFITAISLLFGFTVLAAPSSAGNIFRNITPETDSNYYIGTTTLRWLGIYSDNIDISDTATTTQLCFSGDDTCLSTGSIFSYWNTDDDGYLTTTSTNYLLNGNVTSTSLYTSSLGLNSEYFTDLTGTNLENDSGSLDVIDNPQFDKVGIGTAPSFPIHISNDGYGSANWLTQDLTTQDGKLGIAFRQIPTHNGIIGAISMSGEQYASDQYQMSLDSYFGEIHIQSAGTEPVRISQGGGDTYIGGDLITTDISTTNVSTTNLTTSGYFDFLGTVITDVSTWFSGLFDTNFSSKTTTDLSEGTNLYWTNARFDDRYNATTTLSGFTPSDYLLTTNFDSTFDTRLIATTTWTGDLTVDGNVTGDNLAITNWNTAYGWGDHAGAGYLSQNDWEATTTDALAEGSTNFYYTEARFDSSLSGKSTTDLTEGTNLYWTNDRFDDRYNATTTLSGFTDNSTNWNTAYGWGDWNGNIDISTDTNLAVDSPIILTDDTLSFDFSGDYAWTGTGTTTYAGNLAVSGDISVNDVYITNQFYTNGIFSGYVSSTAGLFTQGSGHYGGNLNVDGNVGIGTTTPELSLSLAIGDNDGIQLSHTNDGGSTAKLYSNGIDRGYLDLYQAGTLNIRLAGGGGTSSFILGGLGIGVTTPEEKLQVAGDFLMADGNNDAFQWWEDTGNDVAWRIGQRHTLNGWLQFSRYDGSRTNFQNHTLTLKQNDDVQVNSGDLYVNNGALDVATTGTFGGAVTGSNLNIANWDTAYGWGDHATAGYFVKATDDTDDITDTATNRFITDTQISNLGTAYTHSQDNTQAHSDYLINNGNDTTSGRLTANGFTATADIQGTSLLLDEAFPVLDMNRDSNDGRIYARVDNSGGLISLYKSDGTESLILSSYGNIGVAGDTDLLQLDTNSLTVNGDVGIGTASPNEKLEVTGNLRFTEGADRIIKVTDQGSIESGYSLTVEAGDGGLSVGNLNLNAGEGLGTIYGGDVLINGGDSAGGDGGDIKLNAGAHGATGDDGNIYIGDTTGKLIAQAPTFFAYKNAVSSGFTTTAYSIEWDVVPVKDSDFFSHTAGTNAIDLTKAGEYELSYSVPIDVNTGTSRSTSVVWATLDGSAIVGSGATGYHRTAGDGDDTVTKTIRFTASAGDELLLRARRYTGGSTLMTQYDATYLITPTIQLRYLGQ